MKKTFEFVGKNVEKAIEAGLAELGKIQDDVDIKILEEGGFFKKAKVELSFDDGKPEPKKEQKYDIGDTYDDEKSKNQNKKNKSVPEKTTSSKPDTKNEVTNLHKQEVSNIPLNKNLVDIGVTFLKGLCEQLGITIKIETNKTEEGTIFKVNGEKVSELIGHRGETLNAIQFILSNVVKNAGIRDERVFLDVENYKLRREESLISLGKRLCDKALKIQKPVRLEPMSAYERRIIHTALQEIEGVFTKSEGEEPRRYLVIVPKKENKK